MAKVFEQAVSPTELGTVLFPYLRDNWTWAGGTETTSGDFGSKTYNLYLDEDKTKAITIRYGGPGYRSHIGIIFKGNSYHLADLETGTSTFEVEITDTALIISCIPNSSSINAANCDKYIICNGYSTNADSEEQIMIYLGSKSSSNVSSIYASDVTTPADMSEQNANDNVNAKTTNLIPFYNTVSSFITTDVYKSLCEDIGAWYFGNVIVNNKAYRMSGSVFALDE